MYAKNVQMPQTVIARCTVQPAYLLPGCWPLFMPGCCDARAPAAAAAPAAPAPGGLPVGMPDWGEGPPATTSRLRADNACADEESKVREQREGQSDRAHMGHGPISSHPHVAATEGMWSRQSESKST